MISIIAAIGRNNELGRNNDLIWHLPKDLKFFKEITINHTVVMGKNTFDSLPKLLENRKHLVLSFEKFDADSSVEIYYSMEDLLNRIKDVEDVFIIGGASLYKQFIPYTDKIYLTEIEEESDADVYFPSFDKNEWNKTIIDEQTENGINYKHVLYERKGAISER